MHAEIISIGDELTSGQRLDTNSQWLSEQLGMLGIRVLFHTTVADDLEANRQAFLLASQRADVVVATGGLGPTADDLTRQALSETTGRPLELDQPSLDHIRNLFRRRQRPMPESNVIQAMFPAGSTPIPNPHGSAPGIELAMDRPERGPAWVFALPGVPAEMKEMWQATVRPRLERLLGPEAQRIRHYRLKCFGVGESDLEQMLPDLIRRGREPQVGITVSHATITLRITASGATDEACRLAMQPTIDTIHQCLGDLVFGEEDEELQHAVVRLLRGSGRTLATAEIVSSGLLSQWLSDAAGAGDTYRGGLVLHDGQALLAAVHEASDAVARHGLDSRELAALLAQQCRHLFQADYGLALGRLPLSDPPREQDKIPLAVAWAGGVATDWAPYGGHPHIRRTRCTKHALDFLRQHLLRR
ncbi:MAG: CinA family nicotinamide mononucleotide deamidase-related protein [Pirellulaceae bacterium]|nr:CinA family nicotinamide mononucleotide deamidase-related protein [Pirellulaceae bacterium]